MKSTKKEVTSGYETITPQKAREYLDTSIGNRPIKAAKVQLFAQYMKAGEWNKYAQPIYFDEDGRLMEGHTRLNAVVKCGATVEMNVVRNFPRAEWSKLNSASIWTAGDFAAANGVKNANSSMSAVKIREALKRGLRIGSIGSVSKGEISINAAYKTVATPPDAQKTHSDTPAPEAANDTPEPSGRATRREIAVPVDSAAPVRRMKNWERFKDRHEATAAHAAEKVVFGCGWGEIEWLYMDYIPDEPRIDYLKRLSKLSILKSEGFKELKRLEKAEKAKKEAK